MGQTKFSGPVKSDAGFLEGNDQSVSFPEWQPYSLQVTCPGGVDPTFGTVVVNEARYSISGKTILIHWNFFQSTAGTAGTVATHYNLSLPDGVTLASGSTGRIIGFASGQFATPGFVSGTGLAISDPLLGSGMQVAIFTSLVLPPTALGPSTSLNFGNVGAVTLNVTAEIE